MRLAIIGDVHGNATALDGVLATISRCAIDAVYFIGDAVGYLSEPARVLDTLDHHAIVCQMGNHEAMLLGEIPIPPDRQETYRLDFARDVIGEERIGMIQRWPDRVVRDVGPCRIALFHGSPRRPLEGYIYPDSSLGELDDLDATVVVLGNTHRPFVRSAAGRVVVNPGSVGLPRDDGRFASWAVIETDPPSAMIYRLAVAPTQQTIEDCHPAVAAVFDRRDTSYVGTVVTGGAEAGP